MTGKGCDPDPLSLARPNGPGPVLEFYRLVQAWIEIHRDELMADWTLAVNGQPVFKIEPLK